MPAPYKMHHRLNFLSIICLGGGLSEGDKADDDSSESKQSDFTIGGYQQESSSDTMPTKNTAHRAVQPNPTSFHSGCIIYHPYHQLVSIGGCFDPEDDTINDVFAFHIIDREWFHLFGKEEALEETVYPRPIWGHSCNYSNRTKLLYVFGGIDDIDNYNNHFFVFSLERNRWMELRSENENLSQEGHNLDNHQIACSPPSGRQGHRTVYLPDTDQIILFGGYSDIHLNDFYYYDIHLNTWFEMEDIDAMSSRPCPREVFSMALNEKRQSIYLFGGKNETTRFNDLYEYSLVNKTWTKMEQGTTIPSPRSSHTCVIVESLQKMILLGGYDGDHWLNDCYEYDFHFKQWNRITINTQNLSTKSLHFFQHGFSSHIAFFNKYENEMLVFGGWDGVHDSNATWSLSIPSLESMDCRSKLFTMTEKQLFCDLVLCSFGPSD